MAWSGGVDMSAWEGSSMAPIPTSRTKPQMKPQGYGTTKTTYNYQSSGRRQPIASLSPGVPSVVIYGIVIAKEEPKNIMSKKNPGSERYLLNFTVRDSPRDFINATCWGGKEHVEGLANLFHIGDIVEINNPVVQSKPNDGRDERFRPITPSPFSLQVRENQTTVRVCDGPEASEFTKLHNTPIKASNDFYTLGDVMANGQNIEGEIISIMAAVRKVGDVKDIVTKTGRKVKKCEVYLFDETCANFLMTLWDEELVNLAQGWIPKEYIIFAADVRVAHDTFRKRMVASSTSQTIFTVNPDTREAYSLYQYAQSADLSSESYSFGMEDPSFDINKVQTVYSVEQLKTLCKNGVDSKEVEHGIVFAYLSSFNLDTEDTRCISARCNHCKRRMDFKTKVCNNLECPSNTGGFGDCLPDYKLEFNILVSLSDHTGTLPACRLDTPYAETVLGCSVDEYMRFSEERKTDLKWKLLLEKCKVYVKLFLPSLMRLKAMVRIMSLSIADPQEAARNIKESEI